MIPYRPVGKNTFGLVLLTMYLTTSLARAESIAVDKENDAQSDETEEINPPTLPIDDNPNQWYLLTWENDMFAFSDDGYTNGIGFSWGYGPFKDIETLRSPDWIKSMGQLSGFNPSSKQNFSVNYAIAQSMYTPEDIESVELVENDRPYAGTLLWRAKIRGFDNKRSNSRGLVLGIVGPAAMAEQTQKFVHKVTNGTEPMGWHHQIANEPVFRFEGEHIRMLSNTPISENLGVDILSYSQGGFGNLRSDIGTGLSFRLGHIFNESYAYINPDIARGGSTIAGSSKQGVHWQIITSIYARYVLNDITLDGNTFKNSHSVDLINEQALVSFGINAALGRWGVLFSMQTGTDSFEQQVTQTKFGSLSITYSY